MLNGVCCGCRYLQQAFSAISAHLLDDVFYNKEGSIMTEYIIRAIMSAGTVEKILAEDGEMKPLSKKAVSKKLDKKLEAGESVSRVAALRMSRGLTQMQLAELTGMKQSNISRIERDPDGTYIENMTMRSGVILAKALGCRMEDLIDTEKVQ